jgi:[ribosomal protein S5]-alanine N-acetyltransferase
MKWTPPTLETARLVLRPITDADADAVFAGCSNPRVTEFTLFETHTTPEFAVALKYDPGRLIGCAGGRWNTQANQCVEFGYWLAEPFWGKGIATEAVRGLVPYLFDALSPERVQAHVMGPNLASARVLEKAGMTYEGTLRSAILRRGRFWDMKMYSILRAECRPSPPVATGGF